MGNNFRAQKLLLAICLFISICIVGIGTIYLFSQKPKVGILYIATGKYIMFWDDFYKSAEQNLLTNTDKTYYVFTDSDKEFPKNVVKIPIIHPGWPDITLKRYHYFQQSWDKIKNNDYLFFFNANCIFQEKIGTEIFPSKKQGLTVTLHPGYYQNEPSAFPYEHRNFSTAYIPKDKGKIYVIGALNGGRTDAFKKMIDTIVKRVDFDKKNGIVAKWHDESHLNKYILNKNPLILGPEYAYPEGWFLDGLPSKIQLRDKNKYGGHKYLRGLTNISEDSK